MGDLQGKVAVVTGGARGIGAATARRLAADGAAIAVIDVQKGACADVVAAIEASGGRAMGFACDVSDAAQVDETFAQLSAALGDPYVLVNNAGVIRDNMLFKMSESDWDTVMNVHLKGHFLCSRAAQRYMVANRAGKIVNVSSTSALGNRGQANYAAAKAGIQGFTKTLSIELGPYNINVNAVAPGFIVTDMTRETAERIGMSEVAFQEAVAKETPLRRVGQPEDIANVVSFLCSADASYVSGQIIYVSGGPRG